jgi:hypothetical protein
VTVRVPRSVEYDRAGAGATGVNGKKHRKGFSSVSSVVWNGTRH